MVCILGTNLLSSYFLSLLIHKSIWNWLLLYNMHVNMCTGAPVCHFRIVWVGDYTNWKSREEQREKKRKEKKNREKKGSWIVGSWFWRTLNAKSLKFTLKTKNNAKYFRLCILKEGSKVTSFRKEKVSWQVNTALFCFL